MKKLLPWILAVAFAGAAIVLYLSNSAKETELAKLREQNHQVETLQAQVDDLQKQAAAQDEKAASLSKESDELIRLRNEVRQLRDDKQQLGKQLQTSQAQIQNSQVQIQQMQTEAVANRTNAEQRVRDFMQAKQVQDAQAACINNLRLIDGAKQTWALENNKTPDAIPGPQELAPYLQNQFFPNCPGGGQYTINAVNRMPTCSIPGHALPNR